MSDWWGTRTTTNQWGDVTEPGTGLAGFFSNPDTGAEVGDRLGIISQILMNLGSGRGAQGIGEAMGNLSERSTARKDKRKMLQMAYRMADKLQGSNPELADLIRANPKYGMELAGKMAYAPIEFEQEEKLARMRGNIDYQKADMLATRKAEREAEQIRLKLAALGITLPGTSSVPTGDIVPNNPDTQNLDTGEAEIQISPLSETSTVPASTTPPTEGPEALPPASIGGVDYTVGLTDIPGLREAQLNLRKRHNDPELPLEDVQLFISGATTGTVEPEQKALSNIAERKAARARVTAFETGANEMARQNQALPGINLQTPGQPELMHAGIDPTDATIVPPNQVPQAAEYLRQSARTGEKEYTSALKDLLQPPSSGWSVDIDPSTGKVTGISQGKKTGAGTRTQEEGRNQALAIRAYPSLEILNRPAIQTAMSTGYEPFTKDLPDWLANMVVGEDFQLGRTAGLNYLSAILRKESMSAVTQAEEILYGRLFLPARGDSEDNLAFKADLRERGYQGMLAGMDELDVYKMAEQATKEFEANKGNTGKLPDVELPVVKGMPTQEESGAPEKAAIPPMSNKARQRGLTPYQWENISDAAREALSD